MRSSCARAHVLLVCGRAARRCRVALLLTACRTLAQVGDGPLRMFKVANDVTYKRYRKAMHTLREYSHVSPVPALTPHASRVFKKTS